MKFTMNKNYKNRQTKQGKTNIQILKGFFLSHKIIKLYFFLQNIIKNNEKLEEKEQAFFLNRKIIADALCINIKTLTPKRMEQFLKQLQEAINFEFSFTLADKTLKTKFIKDFQWNNENYILSITIEENFIKYLKNNLIYMPNSVLKLPTKVIALYVFFRKHNGQFAYSLQHIRNELGYNDCDARLIKDIKTALDMLIETYNSQGQRVITKYVFHTNKSFNVCVSKRNATAFDMINNHENILEIIEILDENNRKYSVSINKNDKMNEHIEQLVSLSKSNTKIAFKDIYKLFKKNTSIQNKVYGLKPSKTVRAWLKTQEQDPFDFDLEFDNESKKDAADLREEIDQIVFESEREYENDQQALREKENQHLSADLFKGEFDDSIPF